MRTVPKIIVALLLLMPSLAFAANGYWDSMIWEQDTWYIGVGRVTGQIVTSATGQITPIVGATITIPETGQSVKSGSDGSYSLSDIPVGKHTIIMQMTGFSSVLLKDVAISDGGTINLSASQMMLGCGVKGDMNDDGVIGLEEAIMALQITCGLR